MNRNQILDLMAQASIDVPDEKDLEEKNWKILERFIELVQGTVTPAARDVLAERRRQIEQEGWTEDHDDLLHSQGDLAAAAACYAMNAAALKGNPPPRLDTTDQLWPWSPDWFKCVTPRRDLVKAGALIQAAIEWGDRNEV